MCKKSVDCQNPENLKEQPANCSAEQIKECHGDVKSHPREADDECCEQPEKLTGKPSDCSPEKIRECHGESKTHPCCK